MEYQASRKRDKVKIRFEELLQIIGSIRDPKVRVIHYDLIVTLIEKQVTIISETILNKERS